jgi:hypothetical protein
LLVPALKGKAKELASRLQNEIIVIAGESTDDKGKPEIIITYPLQKSNFDHA